MKTIQANFKQVLVFGLMALVSCQKENPNVESRKDLLSSSVKIENSDTFQKLSWNPEGSKIEIAEKSMTITAPKQWSYAGFDNEGKLFNIHSMASKSISCTCNNSSGECRPFEATAPLGGGTMSGCAGQCTNCTMKQSFALEDRLVNVYSGGYYSLSAETRLLRNGESAPAVFDALFEVNAFKSEIERFLKEAYGGRPIQNPITIDGGVTAPKGHSLVAISVMGRGMLVVVPDDFSKSQLGYSVQAKASCSCEKGTCTLKDKSFMGAGIVYCQGACTNCTLTTSSLSPFVPDYSIHLPAFTF